MPVEAPAISLSGKSCTVPFISPQTVATGQGLNPLLGSPLINDMGATFNSTEIIIPAGVSKIVMYGSIEGDVPTGETGRVNLDFLVNGSRSSRYAGSRSRRGHRERRLWAIDG
ncbi:MAG TPA: hypothetical protein VHA71_08010 [Rhodanobacteraceae bacterium]|jgi:hypothetical protein|nr:hypothetical protein [Rhodanobacteraceae bacterium]